MRAAPDGATLLLGDLAMAVNPSLFKKLPYDPGKDFSPVAMVSTAPLVLVVHKNTGFKTVNDLVQAARAKPGSITFASAGNGNPPHLAGELFKLTTGTDIVHVPYKGVGPALKDLLGGHVTMLFTGISSTKAHIESGNLVALAVTGPARAPTLPNVPTIAEAGFPGADVTSWWALFVPANTPAQVTENLTRAAERALKNPMLLEKLASQNIVPAYGNQEVLRTTLAGETEKWAKVIKSANIAAD
jgi:tripartite-type tricarboxylate transporter receptor subunit TctC